jgi:hypothetical protein
VGEFHAVEEDDGITGRIAADYRLMARRGDPADGDDGWDALVATIRRIEARRLRRRHNPFLHRRARRKEAVGARRLTRNGRVAAR